GFSDGIYASIFDMPSTVYGPVTPAVVDPLTGKTSGGQVITTNYIDSPTYGKINRSGFNRHTVTNIYSQAGLNLDMSFLTKGLSASGVFMYQTNAVSSLNTSQDYERWVRNDDPDLLTFSKKGINNNTPLTYSKGSQYYYHLTYKTMMDYNMDFGLHHVTGMAYMLFQDLSKADEASPWCLPYDRINSGIEASYGYNQKYLLKFDLGYSGSEQYARNNRFTSTPAISGAWVISRESFMHDLNWLSNLKLRASYGKTANDQSGLGRFAYTDNVILSAGGPIESLRYYVNENQIGNPHIQAEISKKQNYGIDLGLFNSLSISVDLFKERMENMVVGAVATIPSYQGVPLGNYPCINGGAFENKGYEITADYTKAINKDLTVSVGGFLSYAKNTVISWNEALRTKDYAYRKWEEGYSYGQAFGYLVDYSNKNGFFNSQEEIDNSHLTYSFGTPRVGDLKYKDLNNDNIIDEKDKAPIGTGALPRYYYSFNGGLNYKTFDLSFMFQGVGEWSSIYGGTGVYETSNEGIFGSLHRDAWTAQRYANGEKITAPALSLSKSVSHEPNDYYCYNRAYLRLKNVEIGYTLSDNVAKAISVSKIRFILSGQNLLTWDKMKSDDFGPEGSYTSIPVYRVYNVGLNIQF
ncbi:MAG: SusC/RagA family TonB-linked outer membrane protein, partial [Bacteroidota bacterium]|nr:SusC/RagA family TonB-linked outer membrane protein [Bacteroidota bacterium]